MKQSIPCVSYVSLVLLAALLALAGCSAATPIETPDSSPAVSTVPPTGMPSEVAPSSTPSPQSSEEASSAAQCSSPAELTPAMTEGPYFTPGSPERRSLLEDSVTGTRLVITGYVLTQDCRPVPHAMLDFWQADANGVYDNTGYRLRGHQFTDEAGRYQLETILPRQYGGRTPHIHVKVQAPAGPVLTSQLYFPGEPANEADSIFSPQLLVTIENSNGEIAATFDFILAG